MSNGFTILHGKMARFIEDKENCKDKFENDIKTNWSRQLHNFIMLPFVKLPDYLQRISLKV